MMNPGLLNDPLLNSWRSVGDWGFKIVIFGVIGEVLAAATDFISEKCCKKWHKNWKRRLRLIELISGGVLIIGLAFEYRGHQKETQILDSYNAQSYLEAKDAETNAAAAKLQIAVLTNQTAHLVFTNLQLEADIWVLHSNDLFLPEKLLKWLGNCR